MNNQEALEVLMPIVNDILAGKEVINALNKMSKIKDWISGVLKDESGAPSNKESWAWYAV